MWVTSTTALCSSQQLCILVSQTSNTKKVIRQNPHLHFWCIYFNILSDWKLLIYICEMKLAFLGFIGSRNWVRLVQLIGDADDRKIQFSWGLIHKDDTGKRGKISPVLTFCMGTERRWSGSNFCASLLADDFAISLSWSMSIMSALACGFIFYCLSSMWSEESGKQIFWQ